MKEPPIEAASQVIGALTDQPVGGYIASPGTMERKRARRFGAYYIDLFLGRQVVPVLRLQDAVELDVDKRTARTVLICI